VLGALLIAAAAILHWAVVPNQKVLPADTNTTRQLTGTADVLLNPQALASGDLGNALVTGVPITAERSVKAIATDGNKAEVTDSRVLRSANGDLIGQSETNYAVDRKSLEAVTNIPSTWEVTQHEGLTVSWPIGAAKKDYTAWINETKSTTPVKYVREENIAGVNTYVYEASSPSAPIKDEQTLSTLPQSLPASALALLGSRLPLPDEAKAQLALALPSLPDPVPLSYTYEVKSTYWVEPSTGIVIDTSREEIRKVGLGPLSAPVYDVSTEFTEESRTAAAGEATDKRNSINTFAKTIPLSLLIPGLIALVVGLVAWMMGRRRAAPATVPVSRRDEV
jgi:hypothetical protein